LKNIIEKAKNYPGLIIEFMEEKKGPPSGKPLKIRLTSDNLNDVSLATKLIRDKMEKTPDLTNIEDDRDIPAIEWELKIDRVRAAKFGADVALIGNYVQLLTNGMKVTTFNPIDSEEEIDVVVRYPRQHRKLDQFDKIKIKTSSGMVPIENFVNWAPQAKVGTIKRVNTQRTRTIKSDVKQGVLPNTMVDEIKSWLKDSKLPKTVSVQFKGEDEEQEKAKSFLVRAFSVALFIMAVVLVTQFNSFYSAFLILSAVVMSTIGVLIGLLITGKPFGVVMTGVGVIALAGIVVNNNIVLIDTFDYLRKSSQNVKEAVLQAGMERLRPVLLTTVTTILGLLPMVLQINVDFVTREISIGAPSTQWWVSLSTAIVFGLSFATILTLIVTPCALQFRANLQETVRIYREKKQLVS
jgi:multidrug efflux pump